MALSALLLVHMLVGVFLLGAITHQLVASWRRGGVRTGSFIDRYSSVNQPSFTLVVVCLYVIGVILGAMLYPTYRLDIRTSFEDLGLAWAVGLFELKEHFAAIGLCLLPFYVWLWRPEQMDTHRRDRTAITAVIGFIVWWDFLVGHILNNIRGFG